MTKDPEERRNFANFIAMLEDGVLHEDLSEALRDISAEMNDHIRDYGGKAKAKLALTVEFSLENGVFEIVADYKKTLPKAKRRRSIAWGTPENNFTPSNPRQGNLFGPVRDVTSGGTAEIRSV
jgi:hypothetical protein